MTSIDDEFEQSRRSAMYKRCLMLLCLFFFWESGLLAAAGNSIEQSGVARILSRRCLSCHNSKDQRGEFSIQTKSELIDSGMISPGDPESSSLLDVIQATTGHRPRMPKNADPLSPEEVHTIRQWIAAGAVWPEDFKLHASVVSDFGWWSFTPLNRQTPPSLDPESTPVQWRSNPIDAWIFHELKVRGLSSSPPATKRELIRRVTYDLTGLPPTPEEVESFENDASPTAYEGVVNRLLESPAYGEHWARHWLDVVKYADTCGYDKDKLRENAWPYRDYVIRAFNEDKPYSRFIEEQLAGDVLFPGEQDGILGLGLIAAGPWDFIGHVEVPEAKLDGKVARNLDRDDMVSSALNTFCSVTIQCARCHNHKFDPFTQEHYYSLQAIFAAVDRAERTYDLDPAIEQQRQQLTAELNAALQAEKQLKAEIEKSEGEEFRTLTQKIAELSNAITPPEKQPQYGYHSQIANSADAIKWVQIDLGRPVAIHKLILHPCHDDYAGIGSGFGFPLRYRIDGALEEVAFTESAEHVLSLVHEGSQEIQNPGLRPVEHEVPQQTIRFIRITATRLAERKNDYMFALAELEVLDNEGNNVALHTQVAALDSIEAPIRWSRSNFTDGQWAKSVNPHTEAELAVTISKREAIRGRIETPEFKAELAKLERSITEFRKELQQLPTGKMVYAAATHFAPRGNFQPTQGTPRIIRLLNRGNIDQPQAVVSPGAIPLHENDVWKFNLPEQHLEGERRAALAKWISRADHPLTWRSIVNRVWLAHFGEGLVSSPNDFGRMGQLPSHPQLLDWLALEFRDGGQSFKQLHRLIVTSATYQQSSQFNPQNAQLDGSNRYLWRMNRHRLTAEEIRDSILAVSGELDRTPGGPGDRLFVLEHPEHSPHYEYHLFDPASVDRHRRSIYRFVVRSQPDPWMTVLDCADSSQSTPKRSETLTALQALSLMNHDFNLVMAERFATRLAESHVTLDRQLQQGMLLATGREPQPDELQVLSEYAQEHGLPNTCRLLLNFSEFVFID